MPLSGVNTSGVRKHPIILLRSLHPCFEAIGIIGISCSSANLNLVLRVTVTAPDRALHSGSRLQIALDQGLS
jgi:hypothetical protein